MKQHELRTMNATEIQCLDRIANALERIADAMEAGEASKQSALKSQYQALMDEANRTNEQMREANEAFDRLLAAGMDTADALNRCKRIEAHNIHNWERVEQFAIEHPEVLA